MKRKRRSPECVARRLLILTLRPRVNRQALQGWGRDFDLFPAVAYMDTNARFSTFCGNLIFPASGTLSNFECPEEPQAPSEAHGFQFVGSPAPQN